MTRPRFLALLLAAFAACVSLPEDVRAMEEGAIALPNPWGGETKRRYLLRMPSGLKKDERAPAIVLLHDVGETPEEAVKRQGWPDTANKARFAIVALEAGVQSDQRPPGGFFNPRNWNAGGGAAAAWDDVGYLAAAMQRVTEKHPIDRRRIYVVGFGEGGAMAQLALSAGIAAAGFASIAGPLYFEPTSGQASNLYLLFGDADPTNPVAGGDVFTPWEGRGARAALASQFEHWRRALGCDGQATETVEPASVRRYAWTGCAGGGALQAALVSGLGRQWSGVGRSELPRGVTGPASDAIFAPWDIWRFLEDKRLPDAAAGGK